MASTSSSGELRPSAASGVRPGLGQAGNGIAAELGGGDLAALGGFHQFGGNAIGGVIGHDLAHLRDHRRRIGIGRQDRGAIGHAGLRIGFGEAEFGLQRFALRNQGVQISALAGENIAQNLHRREIGAVAFRACDRRRTPEIGKIAIEREGFRFHRRQVDFRTRGQRLLFDFSVVIL